jgi:negative regulator of flagellin synthesis FlgM
MSIHRHEELFYLGRKVMKIQGNRPPETQEMQLRTPKVGNQETPPSAAQGTAKGSSGDTVQISGRTKEMEELKQVINQMPEIRTEKVNELQQSIEAGTYQVNSLNVAGRILEEI